MERIGITLEGKVALVAGGASGIGRATAERFARAGAIVAIGDLASSGGAAVAEALVSEGCQASFTPLDVRDGPGVADVVAGIESAHGGLDILVNAAGILTFGSLGSTDAATWARTIDVNLNGVYNTCHAAIAAMIRRGGGSIVNISSSTGAHDVGAGTAAYVTSKGGVTIMTKSIAVDHAVEGIRCNAIAPGPIDTPMLRDILSDDALAKFGQSLPVGRVGRPEEIAAMALFLASDEASFVTGAIMAVDGGQTAQIGPILGR